MELLLTSTLFVEKLDENMSYELGDVLAPDGITYPEAGVTTYYGFSSSTNSLANAFKYAVSVGLELHSVALMFTFDEEINVGFGLDELPNRKVLSIDKVKGDLGDKIKEIWRGFLMDIPGAWEECIKKGYTDSRGNFQLQGFTNAVADRPYLLSKLWELPEFNHLHIIIYGVLEDGVLSNRATVFRRGNLNYDKNGVIPEIKITRFPHIDIDFGIELED